MKLAHETSSVDLLPLCSRLVRQPSGFGTGISLPKRKSLSRRQLQSSAGVQKFAAGPLQAAIKHRILRVPKLRLATAEQPRDDA